MGALFWGGHETATNRCTVSCQFMYKTLKAREGARESGMTKIKCGCACMPGDATLKSPHHEEYSSSDFQHALLNKFYHQKKLRCFILFSLTRLLPMVSAPSNLLMDHFGEFAQLNVQSCCLAKPSPVVVSTMLWTPARK